jgi:hypothetical protein
MWFSEAGLLAATEDEGESTKAEKGGGGGLGDGGALHKNLFESNIVIGSSRVGDVKAYAAGRDGVNGVLGIDERIGSDAADVCPIAVGGRIPAGIQRLHQIVLNTVWKTGFSMNETNLVDLIVLGPSYIDT